MGLLIAKKEEVVIVMTDYQQDTNAQIDAGDTPIAIDFSKMD